MARMAGAPETPTRPAGERHDGEGGGAARDVVQDGDERRHGTVPALLRRDVVHPDTRIARLAAAQRGVVTFGQLTEAGIGRGAVEHRVKRGRLHRLHRGVYAVGHRALPLLGRETAALLACGPEAVLSHHSAAAVWRLMPDDDADRPVEVTLLQGQSRSRAGITVHRGRLEPRDVRLVAGLRATVVARTLADLAPRLDSRALERVVADALARRLVDAAQLTGHPRLRDLVGSGPRLTRSEAERRLLAWCVPPAFPCPRRTSRSQGSRSTRCGATGTSSPRSTASPSTATASRSSATAAATSRSMPPAYASSG
jgi:Transcriptional regulator, AbiEi antitoxin